MRTSVVLSTLTLALALPAIATAQALVSDADRRAALTHYRSGQDYLATERWEQAADAFRDALRYDRNFTDAHYGLGLAYMGLERFVSAIQAFENCLQAARRIHDLRDRARVATDRDIDDEIRELRDSIRRVGAGQSGAAQPALKTTQLEQRIVELERARSRLPPAFEAPPRLLLVLGSAHFRNGDRQSAGHYWSEAVKVDSGLGEAWNNLAVIHLGEGRRIDAEEAVRRAEAAGFRVNPRLKDDIRQMPER